jgi:hypothetical protein
MTREAHLYDALAALRSGDFEHARVCLARFRAAPAEGTEEAAARWLAIASDLQRQGRPDDATPPLDRAALALATLPSDGLSRRDLLAGAALEGLLSSERSGIDPDAVAHDAVRLADALLRQLGGL